MEEIWKTIKRDKKYEVSNLGRIRNKKFNRIISQSVAQKTDKILSVRLSLKRFRVGYIVAEIFVKNPNNYKYIGFRDGNPLNNIAKNIIWVAVQQTYDNPLIIVNKKGRICSTCYKFKVWDNFYKGGSHCKECERLRKERDKDSIVKRRKQYHIENTDKVRAQRRRHYLNNIDKIKENVKEYRRVNRKKISERQNILPTKYELFEDKLTIEESPRKCSNGALEVKCAYCRKYFKPSYSYARNRVIALNSDGGTENRLYCSDECKDLCPVFHAVENISIREKTDRNRYFRNIVLERDKFECQICGCKDKLEAHHINSPKVSPMEVNDIDNGITLCRVCHRRIHKSISGCGYSELKQCGTT